MEIRAEVHGLDEVVDDLTAAAVTAPAKTYGVVVQYSALVHRQVQANASGRPGPERETGEYVRSIRRRSRPLVAGGYSDVGTDDPRGHRLEAGFAGTDSRGRRIHQRPYAHFGPALDRHADPFAEAVAIAALPR